ncbi:MAG: V4R domain-containing protein [Candidatus Thermoplasmatota archaeon]|nr:V4R domain-containing protein [Candidatus Thermoplasmatota archaeon]
MKEEKEAFRESQDIIKKLVNELPYPDEHGKVIRLNRRFVLLDVSYIPFDVLYGIDEIFGPVSKTILFRIGRRWGDEIYARYESLGFGREDCLKLSAAGAWYFGWGIFTFELGAESSRARIYNSFEVESMVVRKGISDENSCHLFPGVISGIYSRFLGEECSIHEEKCAARGDGYCELVATPGIDLT